MFNLFFPQSLMHLGAKNMNPCYGENLGWKDLGVLVADWLQQNAIAICNKQSYQNIGMHLKKKKIYIHLYFTREMK